jgi:hypothetical protein
VAELDWGGIRIDLTDDMLSAEPDQLVDTWLAAMRHLESAKLIATPKFDEDGRTVEFEPSSHWVNLQSTPGRGNVM